VVSLFYEETGGASGKRHIFGPQSAEELIRGR
jgi:hypothetical protein